MEPNNRRSGTDDEVGKSSRFNILKSSTGRLETVTRETGRLWKFLSSDDMALILSGVLSLRSESVTEDAAHHIKLIDEVCNCLHVRATLLITSERQISL
jgi:hypothetical protein